MMPFGTSSICAFCSSQPSISLCEGCQRRLCLQCLTQHRNDLSVEFDILVNDRNELAELINNRLSANTTDKSSLFDEIDRWATDMHANIDRIASMARENVRECLSETSRNGRMELDRISQELQQKQKTNGYVEGDLNRIKQQLIKLKDAMQQLREHIRIDTTGSKSIPWNSLLIVIPNRDTSRVAPGSPIINSAYYQRPSVSMSIPQQQRQFYPNKSATTSIPSSMGNFRSPSGRSASVSGASRPPQTFTCIGCKTVNDFNEYGRNVCSTCRCPAPF